MGWATVARGVPGVVLLLKGAPAPTNAAAVASTLRASAFIEVLPLHDCCASSRSAACWARSFPLSPFVGVAWARARIRWGPGRPRPLSAPHHCLHLGHIMRV